MPDTLATRNRRADPVITEIVRNGRHRHHRRDEDQSHAHGLQPHHLRGAGLHLRAVHRRRATPCRSASACRCSSAAWARRSRRSSRISATTSQPGDILITNDAYITGSHLNHVTLSVPIFHEGELVGFACCMAHWLDIGGALAASPPTSIPKGCRSRSARSIRAARSTGRGRHHPHECARAGARDGRSARAGRGGEDRREALPGTARALRPPTRCSPSIDEIMDRSRGSRRAPAR